MIPNFFIWVQACWMQTGHEYGRKAKEQERSRRYRRERRIYGKHMKLGMGFNDLSRCRCRWQLRSVPEIRQGKEMTLTSGEMRSLDSKKKREIERVPLKRKRISSLEKFLPLHVHFKAACHVLRSGRSPLRWKAG